MCASLAPKYVKRNYTEVLKHIDLDCVYLDVFSCNEMDECFNPEHKMSRKECMEYRRACFQYMINRGIIPSVKSVVIGPCANLCSLIMGLMNL